MTPGQLFDSSRSAQIPFTSQSLLRFIRTKIKKKTVSHRSGCSIWSESFNNTVKTEQILPITLLFTQYISKSCQSPRCRKKSKQTLQREEAAGRESELHFCKATAPGLGGRMKEKKKYLPAGGGEHLTLPLQNHHDRILFKTRIRKRRCGNTLVCS